MEPLLVPPCPRCGNSSDFERLAELVRCIVCGWLRRIVA